MTTAPTTTPRIGIVTASDRVHRGVYDDRGGPAVESWLRAALDGPVDFETVVVPDEQDQIEAALRAFADDDPDADAPPCCLVVTTGGTGPAPRDVTPEAVEAVCSKLLPGFGEQMRRASVDAVPTAILSRQTAGIRGRTLIVALPGNPAAVDDCLRAVFPAIPHAIHLLGGPRLPLAPGRKAPDPHARPPRRQAPTPADDPTR